MKLDLRSPVPVEEGVEDSEAVAVNLGPVPLREGLPEFPAALFT